MIANNMRSNYAAGEETENTTRKHKVPIQLKHQPHLTTSEAGDIRSR